MTERTRRPVIAGLLSMLLPGAGHVYVGAWRRGLLFLWISGALVLMLLLLAAARPFGMASSLVDRRVLAAFLLANLALLAFRLFAIVDAWRWGRGRASRLAVLALGVIAAMTAAPHVAAAYVTVRGYGVLEAVFADEEPGDVLPANGIFLSSVSRPPVPGAPDQVWPGHQVPATDPVVENPAHQQTKPLSGSRRVLVGTAPSARPWITILLLGSDAGPGQVGERTDTMIVVALQRGTGRAAAFGIPRNLVGVQLGGVAGRSLKRFAEPLNGLYAFARTNPKLFPGGRDPGATALKQTVSRLLGIRVDYYALVDLAGFADIVDALGGVDIHVKERLVDEVTRPAWGEPKPIIDVYPGRTYHFFGREALAYVRSRKATNDYTRMARQRCFLSAMAQQMDVLKLLRHFGSLAATVEASVRTDIPLDRAPDLIRVAGAIDPRQTLTETFGPDYIARRRASDGFPVPDVARIHGAVREMILLAPRQPETPARSVHEAC